MAAFPWLTALFGGGNPAVVVVSDRMQGDPSRLNAGSYNFGTSYGMPWNSLDPILPGQGAVAGPGFLGAFGGNQSLGPSRVFQQNTGPSYYTRPAGFMRGNGNYAVPLHQNLGGGAGYAGSPTVVSAPQSLNPPFLQAIYAPPWGG
jgi:hypothetical protein